MFAAFKMDLPQFTQQEQDMFYKMGLELLEKQKEEARAALDKYFSFERTLNASEIEKDWFPAVNADVFLSHSQQDNKQVIAFAGYLSKLGMKVFVDFCVWGYADDLLKKIENDYCRNSDGHTYNYEAQNNDKVHVHSVLKSVLFKMIEQTECLIFIDVPDSFKGNDIKSQLDFSWMYSELLLSKIINKKVPVRMSESGYRISESFSSHNEEDTCEEYRKQLMELSRADFDRAACKAESEGNEVLDQLYYMKQIYKMNL